MCSILNNSIIKKLIVVLLVITLVINIFPNKVQADSFLEAAGGAIISILLRFAIFLGDTVLEILQNNFISTEDIVIEAQSDKCDTFSGWDLLKLIVGLLVVIVSIVIAVTTFGGLSWVGFAGVSASIKFIGGIAIKAVVGGCVAVWGASGIIAGIQGKFDLPQIRYTPYEIFSNQIPLLDVNFIEPMEAQYSQTVINDNYTAEDFDKDNGGEKEYELGIWNNCKVYIYIYDNGVDIPTAELRTEKNNLEIKSKSFVNIDDLIKNETVINFVTNIIADKTAMEYINENGLYDDINFLRSELHKGVSSLKQFEINGINYEIISELDDNTLENVIFSRFNGIEREIARYELNLLDSVLVSTQISIREDISNAIEMSFKNTDKEETISQYMDEIKGKLDDMSVGKSIAATYQSSASILQQGIATWYKVLRRVALVGLLSVLLYIGIRIIFGATAGDKAKYKKMFLNWLVAVCILFVLHYLMVFIVTMSEKITEIFLKKGEPNIVVELPIDTSIDGKGLPRRISRRCFGKSSRSYRG